MHVQRSPSKNGDVHVRRLNFSDDTQAAAEARRLIATMLRPDLPAALLDCQLVASELVSMAAADAGGGTLIVRAYSDRVRVELYCIHALRAFDGESEEGLGWRIIAGVASAWRARTTHGSTAAWAELLISR